MKHVVSVNVFYSTVLDRMIFSWNCTCHKAQRESDMALIFSMAEKHLIAHGGGRLVTDMTINWRDIDEYRKEDHHTPRSRKFPA